MDDVAAMIMERYRTWAVVGLSPDASRPSHGVASQLQEWGYRVVPINPNCEDVLGEPAYRDLASVPSETDVEVVDIFRRSEFAGGHVDEAIATGARAVWMQLGVIDEEAAARARAAGLLVVMDRCPAIEGRRLGL